MVTGKLDPTLRATKFRRTHVFDGDEAQRPFTFIPTDATARILRDIRQLRRQRGTGQDVESRRYSDDEIAAVGGRDDIVMVKGPPAPA